MKNGDIVRGMTDEQLTAFLHGISEECGSRSATGECGDCEDHWCQYGILRSLLMSDEADAKMEVPVPEEQGARSTIRKEIFGTLYEIGRPTYAGGRIPKSRKNDWTICEWDEGRKYCFVIAELIWDGKEGNYELKSIGMRLAESGSTELLKWIWEMSSRLKRDVEE